MLRPADGILVRRDPALPALACLLDAEAARALFARAYPRATINAARPSYVRYKPGMSCVVSYRLDTSTGALDAYAKAHHASGRDKLVKAAERHSVPSALGGGVTILDDEGIVLYPFPNDHELRTYKLAGDGRAAALRHLLRDHPSLWEVPLEPLRYNPERRFVARVARAGGPAAAVRFYAAGDFKAVVARHNQFECRAPLRIARTIKRSKTYRAASVEWLDGPLLSDLFGQARPPAEPCRLVGVALAHLHAQPAPLTEQWTAPTWARAASDAAAALAPLVPQLAARTEHLGQRIASDLLKVDWRSDQSLHGDFSADQLIVLDDAIGVLDLDRAATGDGRVDLATFRARLEYDVALGHLDEAVAQESVAALLDGYVEASGGDADDLHAFTAAALVRLASEPFRRRLDDWPRLIGAIVGRAEDVATSRGGLARV